MEKIQMDKFTISVLLNIVLSIALFFKSALNDILKEIWVKRQNERKEKQNIYINLKMQLESLDNIMPFYLFNEMVYWHTDDKQMKMSSSESLKEHIEKQLKIFNFLKRNEHNFPSKIYELTNCLEDRINSARSEVAESIVNTQQRSQLAKDINIREIIELVDIQIRKLK